MTDFYEDACYLSNSEAEPDSEVEDFDHDFKDDAVDCVRRKARPTKESVSSESFQWEDPQALLDTWLGELDNLNVVSASLHVPFIVAAPNRFSSSALRLLWKMTVQDAAEVSD